ncbi:MAG TPA: TrkH family potassium uptake protein [Thermoguttaceae bacterium]|nr:TrkH family potassium uptake protein [Thermoguttaceae bacterium]
MNKQLICRLLGLIALLIGGSMAFSLPWTLPVFGQTDHFEADSFFGLLGAMAVCSAVGGVLMFVGRRSAGEHLFRREAMAVVGLSWLMATLLGAIPFWLSGTCAYRDADDRPVRMDIADGLFESGSGFSGTGATVLTDLEDPELVPRAILFWRSETHFLGGLGIMVLFVAILGLGSAGKTLMLTEMPGPSKENVHARTQSAAWNFTMIFVGLTVVLTLLLRIEGMSLFDALCHAFGTIATGGFSTYNSSVEHFQSISIEMTIALFMFIACTNFTLLYYVILCKPGKLFSDVEFRVYVAIIAAVSLMLIVSLRLADNFDNLADASRYAVFQVVSIITNTGFGTYDFDRWNAFSRAMLFLLMFIGGCAGSTSCSVKVIRYVLFFKILWLELERMFHPTVVRPLRLGGTPLADQETRKDVVLYFGAILVIFVGGWIGIVAMEPDATWNNRGHQREKLMDCASAVAATLNGVGPGLGIVGESQNYARFHAPAKMVLTLLMLLGRLEIFVLIALFMPRFWRRR